jgi:site-specific DNA recombinase
MMEKEQALKASDQRKRAIIYCRVSTEKQGQDGESLEYQEEKCRLYALAHDIDVVDVLKEAKSGYIHYTLREKLTLARQLVRDGFVHIIIVWDLRRFSRNFVHSSMIFEEIESAGGEVVSVSENIDNSLTGKLIRSILAWSAESEREKIVEYANRHWQARLEQNLPMATGRAPYGWKWQDKEKSRYVINKEEATVRFSIVTMFIDQDMSIRAIAHKLTEDGVLPPAKSRGAKVKSTAWQPSTVHKMLCDVENIGILRICKSKKALTAKGTETREPNSNMKTVADGIPAIIPIGLYELAQYKLKHNQADKSKMHRKPEDFLLKGHIICKTCGCRMTGTYKHRVGATDAYYRCCKVNNKYDACPDLVEISANKLNKLVWEDCCRVFESIELIRDTIHANIERDLQNLLENTRGKQLYQQLQEEIIFAEEERAKYPQGSYYYNLISQDLQHKQTQLSKYEQEYKNSEITVQMLGMYQQNVMSFLEFLTTMKGRYQEASFTEQCNALDVLRVTVHVHAAPQVTPPIICVETDKEWLSLREAAALAGISEKIVWHRASRGEFRTYKREESRRCTFVHRDEFNRFLSTLKIHPQHLRDNIGSRVEIDYAPILTGVQSSLIYTLVPMRSFIAG